MHRLPRILALTAVLASAVTLLPPPATAAARPSEGVSSRQDAAVSQYDGTFVGDLTYRRRDDYGGPNYSQASADIKVRSTLLGVRLYKNLVTSSGKGKVKVTGTGASYAVTDDGLHVVDCTIQQVNPTTDVAPFLVSVLGKPTFYAFTSLSVVHTCYDDDELLPYSTTTLLPAIPVPVAIPRASRGTARIVLPIDRTFPKAKCPESVSQTTTCTYRLHGTLVLRRVPDIEIFKAPTKPVVKKKVSITTSCTASCTATLEVRPLRGPGRITTKATLRPSARKVLTVRPGPDLGAAIRRSGGARLEVTYRSGTQTKTYTRVVRS